MTNFTNETVINQTNRSSQEEGSQSFPALLIAFIALQQIVFLLGCTGNGIAITVFIKYLKLDSNMNIVSLNMAIADFIQGLGSGAQAFYFFMPFLNKNMHTCFVRFSIISYPLLVSQCMVTVATFDRFVAINFPHIYMRVTSRKCTWLSVVMAHLIAFIMNILPSVGMNNWKEGSVCELQHVKSSTYLLLYSAFIITLMTMTMLFYIFILRKALAYQKRLNKTKNKTRNAEFRRNILLARALGIATLVFTVSWLPYHAFEIKFALGDTYDFGFGLSKWFVFIGIARCVVNPFIYMWHRKDFNTGVRRLICGKKRDYRHRETESGTSVKHSTNRKSEIHMISDSHM